MTGNGRIAATDFASLRLGRQEDTITSLTAEEWAERDRQELRMAQEEVRAARIARRLASLLAARSQRFAGDWPLPEAASRWAACLAAGNQAGVLWFGGTRGSGKTTAAWATMAAAVRAGYAGRAEVVKAGQLLAALAPPVDAEAKARWALADLLFVDDFGKNGTSPWERAQLHEIFDARYEAYRPLIITSEVKIQPLVDPATWSRWDENLTPVHMGNTDHRRRT